ncbi:unnamed protein product [Strongylus vulgaris]|uniref:Uncharacterized protein n=1 Tax=Strongylus vulgaris TaxID=40348 RepID=A0A3P7KAJ8_STRVU|nr:unnamed protein product [Strongylus vulgaris]
MARLKRPTSQEAPSHSYSFQNSLGMSSGPKALPFIVFVIASHASSAADEWHWSVHRVSWWDGCVTAGCGRHVFEARSPSLSYFLRSS